ncbi:MAG: S8 family serine peptidase [Deltaproteobacteria bacterium]
MNSFFRYLIAVISLMVLVLIAPASSEAFTDTGNHWAGLEIEHLQSREIISGYPGGSYRPGNYISRQEFVVLLIRALNAQQQAQVLSKGESSFDDTAQSWARGYVELAYEMGIVQGDSSDSFSPTRAVSRQEAITMLANCLHTKAPSEKTIDFSDEGEISSWARPAVAAALENGLVHGFPDGSFRPRNNITRAETAILLESLLANQGGQYQIYGTIISINLPLHQASIKVAGKTETFEIANNLAVWSGAARQKVSEIAMPATAYMDLNSNGKLAFVLITESQDTSRVDLNYSRLSYLAGEDGEEDRMEALTETGDTVKSTPVNEQQAAVSLRVTGEAMGVSDFSARTGATGRGQLVAVIDSGIDPGHPDLQTTSEGYAKMLDFIDLTNEGKVALNTVKASRGNLQLGEQRVDVNGLGDSEGTYKYGYLQPDFLPADSGFGGQKLLVVLTSSKKGGVLDTVYIDTDSDGQINDEAGVKVYSELQQIVRIKGEQDRSFNIVVSEIAEKSEYIKLGFDALGHGTEVAGIVAAQGKVRGMAPDAQLLVIKIMDSQGTTSLAKLESALSLAADRGAGVAVISLGQYDMSDQERASLAKNIDIIWKSKGMIICMAAGNSGPGLATVADTTGINNVITVGAYATPQMWKTDYGWVVPQPTLWYFSSAGPAANASASPLLLAPGSAVSTYPEWADIKYHKDEGTSIAAPHAAGAAALLLDANQHILYSNDHSAVFEALLTGARTLEDLQTVEQGFGGINLLTAWEEVQNKKGKIAAAEARQYTPGYGLVGGLYARGMTPASLLLHLSNTGDTTTRFSLGGLSEWIKPQEYTVQVPAHSERTVTVNYDLPGDPGLYSSFLVADDPASSGADLSLLQTVVVPFDLGKLKDLQQPGKLGPGQMEHYYFAVPKGTDKVVFKLAVDNGKGRARIVVLSPNGNTETSFYAGTGPNALPESSLSYSAPAGGIWEVVVYSSVSLSDYKQDKSEYLLSASIFGDIVDMSLPPDDRYFVSTVMPTCTPGKPVNLTLFFWNRGSKLPASGLVSIDGKLYEIQNGRVSFSYVPQQETINLKLAW